MSQGQEEGGGTGVVGIASGTGAGDMNREERRAGSRAEEAKDDGVHEAQQRPASAAPAASSMLVTDGARPGEQEHDHQQQEEAGRATGQASSSSAGVDGGSTVAGGVDYPEAATGASRAADGHEDGAVASSSSASSSSSSGNDERDDGNADGSADGDLGAATKVPDDGAVKQDGGDNLPSAVASDAAAAEGGGGGGGGGDGQAVRERGDVVKQVAEKDEANVHVAGVEKDEGEATGPAKSGKLPSGQARVELPTAEEAKIQAHEERHELTLEERKHEAEKLHIERTHHRLEQQQGGGIKPNPPGAAGRAEKERRKLGASMSLSIPNLGFAIPYGPNRESARSK